MIILILFVLVLSMILIYFVSRRYNLRPTPFVLSNTVGFVVCALMGNLIFSFIMEPSFVFTDFSSILGGGLSWTAVVVAAIMALRPSTGQLGGQEFAADNSVAVNYSMTRAFWTLIGQGLVAVMIAILSATAIDFMVFVIYGFIGIQVTDLPILIARITYVVVCTILSYFIFRYLSQRKAELIHQAIFSKITQSAPQQEQDVFAHGNKSKRNLWLWGCSGSILIFCIILGAAAFYLFSPSKESYPLNGKVSYPSTVKKGEQFDFIVTLTNSTTNPIFIKHVVLQTLLDTPSLLDGAKVISVEPDMDSERIAKNDVQYAYFQEIQPGETLTFVFHLQAENIGSYIEDVGVYAKHPFLDEPYFQVAFHATGLQIEITP